MAEVVVRRGVMIAAYALAFAALTLLMPLWLPFCALGAFLGRARFQLPLFLWWYLALELFGVGAAGLVALLPVGHVRRQRLYYRLQSFWTRALWWGASSCFDWQLVVTGHDALEGGAFALLPRHSSLADTLLPGVTVAGPTGRRLRYVLKKELTWDPCLDVVGHRLPNLFVDRSVPLAQSEQQLTRLAESAGDDGILIYPEGTRFSSRKREHRLGQLANSPYLEDAKLLRHTLPPKFGGFETVLNANPDLDVVFMAHEGLEPISDIRSILSNGAVGLRVSVHFWRVPRHEIPDDKALRRAWLYQQWRAMDAYVGHQRAVSEHSAVRHQSGNDRTPGVHALPSCPGERTGGASAASAAPEPN